MFSVEYRSTKGHPSRVNCEIDSLTIGKADDNLIVLRGWTVGKRHATIHKRSTGFFVEDHGSMGVTEVNGNAIDKEYGPLRMEDVIRIGDNYLNVIIEPAQSEVEITPSPKPEEPVVVAISSPSSASQNFPATKETSSINVPEPVLQKPPEKKFTTTDTSGLTERMNAARLSLHGKLISQMDLRRVDVRSMSEDELRSNTQAMIADILASDTSLSPDIDATRLARELLNEVIGLGPLEDLLADPDISEIMVNRYDEIYVERKGKLTKADIAFSTDQAVLGAIERIVAPIGRRIDESSPMVDARLKDGSRVNAVIPPLALKGCNITIRKF